MERFKTSYLGQYLKLGGNDAKPTLLCHHCADGGAHIGPNSTRIVLGLDQQLEHVGRKAMGSRRDLEVMPVEVLPVDFAEATEAPVMPPITTAAIDSFLQQSKGLYKSWLAFVWGLVLFGMVNYREFPMVLVPIVCTRVFVASWVQKVQTWARTLPVLSGFMFKPLIVGVLLVDMLIRHVWGYVQGLGFI